MSEDPGMLPEDDQAAMERSQEAEAKLRRANRAGWLSCLTIVGLVGWAGYEAVTAYQAGTLWSGIRNWAKANWVFVLVLLSVWQIETALRSVTHMLGHISEQLDEIGSDVASRAATDERSDRAAPEFTHDNEDES